MIRYALACKQGCQFEAWFRDSADFDDQAARGLVECPQCGEAEVRKQIMAPAVASARKREARAKAQGAQGGQMQTMAAAAGAFRKMLRENFENVGNRFPAEARAIHDGEAPARGIYGEASPEEARTLREEGVEVLPLPRGLNPDADKELN